MRPRKDPAIVRTLVELYAAGCSYKECGEAAGLSAAGVYYLLRRAGVQRCRRRRNSPPPADAAQIMAELYAAGHTLQQCGEAVGKGQGYAWHVLHGLGLLCRRRRVSAEQRDRVVEAYVAGATMEAAAAAGGCSLFTAWSEIVRRGLRREPDPGAPAAIAELARQGLTAYEIAQRLELNLGEVMAVLY
jgi:DNA-binding CsgD family transcriptional regulator